MANLYVWWVVYVRKALQPIVPESDRQTRKTRRQAGFFFDIQSMMTIFMFVFVVPVTTTGMSFAAIATQVVAHCTTRRTTQTSTDGRTGGAAQAVADHRTAGSAEATANGGFGAIVFIRPDRAARRATNTRTDRGTGAATELTTDHITEHTAQTATHGGAAISGGHRTLSDE